MASSDSSQADTSLPSAPARAWSPAQRVRQAVVRVLGDRARLGTFFRFVLRRFLDDRLFQAAGALSFTTAFALVPMSMVVFGVLSAFPVYTEWSDSLSAYVFANFVPSSARAVEAYLREFSRNTGQLTAVGVIVLVVSLLITLRGIESAFNRIWRVPDARPRFSRFLVYWTVLTFGALLAAASLALSARFFALAVFSTLPGQVLESWMLRWSPVLVELLALVVVYRAVPYRRVPWLYAAIGALAAVLAIEILKIGVGSYLGSFGAYQKIYGPLAFVPIFLGWIYLGWVAILFGASLAAALAAFRYQPAALRLPRGYELYGLLRLIGRFAQARGDGRGLSVDEIRRLEPILTDSLVQQMLTQLAEIRLIAVTETSEWMLARDLHKLTLAELYDACQLRVPIAEAWLPAHDDPLGTDALAALDALRVPLREALKRPVSSFYPSLFSGTPTESHA